MKPQSRIPKAFGNSGTQRDSLCSPTKCTKYLTAKITENAEILKIKKKIVTSANSAYSAVNANNREL